MNLSTEIYLYTESSHSWNLPITEPTYGNLHVKCLYQVKSRYQRYNVTEIYTKSAHNPLNMVGVLVFEPCYFHSFKTFRCLFDFVDCNLQYWYAIYTLPWHSMLEKKSQSHFFTFMLLYLFITKDYIIK